MNFVNVNGDPWEPKYTVPAPKAASSALKRTADRDSATVSDGFLVKGYPAGTPEKITNAYRDALKDHERKPKDFRHPGIPDDFTRRWYTKNKPQRIERKFFLASAAETCAELARKAGWLDVRVEEVLKA